MTGKRKEKKSDRNRRMVGLFLQRERERGRREGGREREAGLRDSKTNPTKRRDLTSGEAQFRNPNGPTLGPLLQPNLIALHMYAFVKCMYPLQ